MMKNNQVTQTSNPTSLQKTLVILAFCLLLQACATQVKPERVVAETSRKSLATLLAAIPQAPPHPKNSLLLQAVDLLLQDNRFDKAQELILKVNLNLLPPLEYDDYRLYQGLITLNLGIAEEALNQLRSIHEPSKKSLAWQLRYQQTLADAHLANFNYFESAKIRIDLEDLLGSQQALENNNEKIWFSLNQLETDFLQQLITDFNSQRLNGWLEVVYINRKWGYHPDQLIKELELWRKRYPLHPSQVNQPQLLKQASSAELFSPKKIAVLLPLSGKNASIGSLIRDGIIAAHYQSKSSQEAPLLSFYDTASSLSGLTAYQKAIDEGADFILGPLTKPVLETIIQQESLQTPILALNQVDTHYSHPKVFQFGLPPEDEAIQAALRANELGLKKAIALLPENSVGERVEQVFKQQLESLGGELVTAHKYTDSQSVKQDVQQLLGVDRSTERKRKLQQLLGRNLEFEMRRRQDADFIFLVAAPNMGRMIKPFIDYYYAYDLPVISTSQIFSGERNGQIDQDLNGIEFSDIPLLISEQDPFIATREQLKTIEPEATDARLRYFSLGFDSYKILPQLNFLKAFPDFRISGLTGQLGLDQNGLVHRTLTWAKFSKGLPQTTKEIASAIAINNDQASQP